jgi:hypothetical protein
LSVKKLVEEKKAEAEKAAKPLLEEIAKKQASLQEELRQVGRQYISQGADELFEQFPKLKSFGWTQYTPYFNDGDECVFGVHNDESTIDINGSSYDDRDRYDLKEDDEGEESEPDEYEDEGGKFYYYYIGPDSYWFKFSPERAKEYGITGPGWYKAYYSKSGYERVEESVVPWRRVAAAKVAEMLGTLASTNEGFFKDLFGDHVKVTITRDGYETEEYEHE